MANEHKITHDRLREIIKEELAAVNEQVDHSGIRDVVNVASKLLAAVEAFKQKAPPAAMNAVTPGLAELEKALESMVSTPGSYVPRPKKEPQKVTLKAVKGEGALRESVAKIAKRSHGGYTIESASFGIVDLQRDLPKEAAAAQRDIPRAALAKFGVKNGEGPLVAHVTKDKGTSADWFQYDERSDAWHEKSP